MGSAVPAEKVPAPPEEPADGLGLDPALTASGGAGSDLGAQPRAQATILVLRLPDSVLAQEASGTDTDTLAQHIACAAQEIAAAQSIPYLKMLGASIVAAAGYGPQADGNAAVRLAEMAIALRERCAAFFESIEDSAEFGIGLDSGAVAGGTLGQGLGLFNLWGEAVQGAQALAGSAPAGAIQVSERTYSLLRQGFLFRPRGLFYRPGAGGIHSYILAGRI